MREGRATFVLARALGFGGWCAGMPGCYAVFHKQLGDLVLLEPALNRLKEFHGASVTVMTRTGHAPVLDLMSGVEFQRGAPLRPHPHLYGFDPLNKSALRSLFAPVLRKTLILPERREMKWFHPLVFGKVIVPELSDNYVARYFWENTPVPATGPFRPPQLNAPPAAWQVAEFAPGGFILLNPTSGWRKKSWLPERWAEVMRGLQAETGLPFVMTSGTTDWQIAQCAEIRQLVGPSVHSLASGTTLEQFLWLCANAAMVLTVDGAASHLAAAFGVKALTLFGPTSMHNWHFPSPRNQSAQAEPSSDGVRRMRNLAASAVAEASVNLWRS